MMNLRISPKDQVLLNAYIDDELSARRRIQLESRLERESELKRALADIQNTRNLLRSLSQLRAPRNFTLKPEMLGYQYGKNLNLFNNFRMISAAVSIVLFLVLTGDFFIFEGGFIESHPIPQGGVVNKTAEREILLPAALEAETQLDTSIEVQDLPAEEEVLIQDEIMESVQEGVESESLMPETFGASEADSTALDVPSSEAPVPEQEDLGEYSGAIDVSDSGGDGESEGEPRNQKVLPVENIAEEGLIDEQMITPTEESVSDAELEYKTFMDNEFTETDSVEYQEDIPQTPETDDVEIGPTQNWSMLRLVETILALIAAISGVLTIYFWKTSRNAA